MVIQVSIGQERKVAITIDDLVATGPDMEDYAQITQKLLQKLKGIPAIGFVNEGKLYTDDKPDPDKIQMLEKWLSAGKELGNHTFSHVYIDSTTLENYKADVLKGEKFSKALMEAYGKELTYFRHPQLRTGPTDTYREQLNGFLNDYGYTIAPVTIDNDEYIYANLYGKAKRQGNLKLMQDIAEDYLAYMEEIFEYYESLSEIFLGYEVPQILLIHANNLNADYMTELVLMMTKRGYSFISLSEALMDNAYALPTGTHARGLSWIQRWMIAQGIETQNHPDVSEFIKRLSGR